MTRLGKGIGTGIVAIAIGVAGGWWIWQSAERTTDAAPATEPSRLSTENGQTIVTLSPGEQSRSELQLAPLQASDYKPQFAGYGTLAMDPAASMTLRAPFAGTLRAGREDSWPTIGDVVQQTVAFVDPRYTPIENVDVISRLTTAQADVTTATSALAAARSEYEADVKLNRLNKNVSDRAVQDARAAMEQQTAKLESAKQTVSLLQKAVAATTQPATTSALSLKGEWDIVEVGAHPGETVDAGQLIFGLARLNRLIATVALPAGETIAPDQVDAQVFTGGQKAHPMKVLHAALAPAVDPRTMGETFVLQIDTGSSQVRPGTPVTAIFTPKGKGQQGLIIPQAAVVWHDGKAWVYVEIRPHQFVRREVATTTPVNDGWFVPAANTGFSTGEPVVLRGAQQLLSEEFKPVLPAGGDVDDD